MEPPKQSLEGLEELRDVLQLCSPAKWYCPAGVFPCSGKGFPRQVYQLCHSGVRGGGVGVRTGGVGDGGGEWGMKGVGSGGGGVGGGGVGGGGWGEWEGWEWGVGGMEGVTQGKCNSSALLCSSMGNSEVRRGQKGHTNLAGPDKQQDYSSKVGGNRADCSLKDYNWGLSPPPRVPEGAGAQESLLPTQGNTLSKEETDLIAPGEWSAEQLGSQKVSLEMD